MIIFHQISRETLQMKFDEQEWATRGNFVSYEIRNHDRKAYSKTSIPWEKKILWCNHNYSDSRCNSQFNESKSIIKQQLTPPPLSLNCSKRSVDSGNNFKARDANAPPLWNQLTYSHSAEEELTSLMRSSWNLTWRTGSADNCSDSSVAGGDCGSSTISSADSAEHEGSWIRGSGWEIGAGPGSCTSEAVSIEPTVLWWSPRHCLQTPAYKNKPKMSFGSIVVY